MQKKSERLFLDKWMQASYTMQSAHIVPNPHKHLAGNVRDMLILSSICNAAMCAMHTTNHKKICQDLAQTFNATYATIRNEGMTEMGLIFLFLC